MPLDKGSKSFGAILITAFVLIFAIAMYESWTIFLPNSYLNKLGTTFSFIFYIVSYLLVFKFVWNSKYTNDSKFKRSWLILVGGFALGLLLKLFVIGLAALSAKLAPSFEISKCYEVSDVSSYRKVHIDIIDPVSRNEFSLMYSRRLGSPSITVGPDAMFARIIGNESWFGIIVDRIESDVKCDPDYSPNKQYKNIYVEWNMSSVNFKYK